MGGVPPPSTAPIDAGALLEVARAARVEGHYLRQLESARRCASVAGPHREAALLESLESLVQLARFGEARQVVAMLRAGGPRVQIRAGLWLSHVEALEGDASEGRRCLEDIRELLGTQGEPHDHFLASIAWSRVEHVANHPLAAIEHAERALAVARALEPDAIVTAHFHTGELWLDLGAFDRAVASFEAGLALGGVAPARRAALHVGACRAQRRAGDAEAAWRHGQQAVALHFAGGRSYREGLARLVLAEALLLGGRRAEALAEARVAIERIQMGRSAVSEMEGRLCLAKILLAEGLQEAGVLELLQVLGAPVPTLHDEVLVLLAEHATRLDDPHVVAMEARFAALPEGLKVRAAWVLATLCGGTGRVNDAQRWFAHYGDAREAAATHEARRHYRVVEIRDQVVALRRERHRAGQLAAALRSQKRLREAAESAEAERRDLLELVAHDLRNPLSALLLMLDGVDEAEDVAEVRELVVLGRRSAVSMRGVLDEALTASGSIGEMGQTEPVRLDHVVREAVGAFEAGARAKGQAMALGAVPEIVVDGVRGLLRSVLENLLSNALKFTPRGGAVQVSVAVEGDWVRLDVVDDGPGLVAGEAERLFQRRVRGSARPTAGEPSTGLGLYLVRKVVEGHGGTVSATSDGPGKGATFTVMLHRRSP